MHLQETIRHNALTRLYEEAGLSAAIRRSLNFILLGNICGSAHGIICGGGTTAMVGLASQLGAGDLVFGILAAIPQAAALLQIPYSMLVNRTHKRKKYMLTLGMFSRVLWILVGLIPLLVPASPAQLRLWSLIFLLGVSNCCGAVINVCWLPWLTDLAPLQIRGRWLSVRETLLAASNMVIGLVVAYLLDHLPPETRYIIIFIIGGVIGMIDMACFGFCEERYSAPPKRLHFKEIIRDVAKNVPFRRLLLMWTVWCFTGNMCGVYFTPYSMNVMGLSFMQIMVFATITCSVATILAMPRWGKLMHRFGCRSVMMAATVSFSLMPLFYLFSSPGNIWPTFLYSFFGGLTNCGATLAANSMQLSYSPDESRPSYIALFACVPALLGTTLGSLAGGALLEHWNSMGWFTGYFDRYKMLTLACCVLRLAGSLLLVAPLQNDREGTTADLVRSLLPQKKK